MNILDKREQIKKRLIKDFQEAINNIKKGEIFIHLLCHPLLIIYYDFHIFFY